MGYGQLSGCPKGLLTPKKERKPTAKIANQTRGLTKAEKNLSL